MRNKSPNFNKQKLKQIKLKEEPIIWDSSLPAQYPLSLFD